VATTPTTTAAALGRTCSTSKPATSVSTTEVQVSGVTKRRRPSGSTCAVGDRAEATVPATVRVSPLRVSWERTETWQAAAASVTARTRRDTAAIVRESVGRL
jgi:hypothetical protein